MSTSMKVVSLAAFQQSRKPQATVADCESGTRDALRSIGGLSRGDREEMLRSLTACAVTAMENRERLFEEDAGEAVRIAGTHRPPRRFRVLRGGRG